MSRPTTCRGSWELGTACGKCDRCVVTDPKKPLRTRLQVAADRHLRLCLTEDDVRLLVTQTGGQEAQIIAADEQLLDALKLYDSIAGVIRTVPADESHRRALRAVLHWVALQRAARVVSKVDVELASKLVKLLAARHGPLDHDFVRDERRCAQCRDLMEFQNLVGRLRVLAAPEPDAPAAPAAPSTMPPNSDVYVPGVWDCARCKLTLVSQRLNTGDGTVTPNTAPQACPNGCGPMWRVTWQQRATEAMKLLEDAAEWRNAVIDGLVAANIYRDEHFYNPRAALNELVCWHEKVSLDPAVSAAAHHLAALPQPMLEDADDKTEPWAAGVARGWNQCLVEAKKIREKVNQNALKVGVQGVSVDPPETPAGDTEKGSPDTPTT